MGNSLLAKFLSLFVFAVLLLAGFGIVVLQTLSSSIRRLDTMIEVTTTANQLGVVAGTVTHGPLRSLSAFSTGSAEAEDSVVQASKDLRTLTATLMALQPNQDARDSLQGLANLVEAVRHSWDTVRQMIHERASAAETNGTMEQSADLVGFLHDAVSELTSSQLEQQVAARALIRRDTDALQGDFIMGLAGLVAVVVLGAAWILITNLRAVRRRFQEILDSQRELEAARDAAESANRAKSAFLANMSHEIRTPMNAIFGMNHLALQTGLSSKQRHYLESVDVAARRLLSLVNDILDYSKIEAGKMTLEQVPFNLETLVNDALELQRVAASEKGLELLFHPGIGLPKTLEGDPSRVTQILVNLLGNSVKFTPKGEIVLSVEVDPGQGGQFGIRFNVRDTGIGMSEDQLGRLFRSFSQADESITRRYGGTGLGLVICRQLAHMMGGTLGVSSVLGEGSLFTLWLPFADPRAENSEVPLGPVKPWEGMRVLVADDSPSSLVILGSMLRSLRLEPLCVDSGPAALEALREGERQGRPFSLVILDWRMPSLDGVETARRMAAEHPGRQLKILMVTSYSQEEVIQSIDSALFASVLVKPVLPSVLLDTIANTFGAPSPRPSSKRPRADLRFAGNRVLLVEDNAVNREIAVELLEGAGLTVVQASSGAEAVSLALGGGIELVLMDIQMPGMDGLEASRLIRASDRQGMKSLPMVAMTAHAMADDVIKSYQAGLNGHLTKPIEASLLFAEVARWIAPLAPGPVAVAEEPQTEEEIPGLDASAGLVHANHDRALFRKMLSMVCAEYSPFESKWNQFAAEDNREAAENFVHNLKSSAGFIGAKKLQSEAAAVEKALRQGSATGSVSISGLLEVLKPLMAVLAARVISQPPRESEPLIQAVAAPNPALLADLLQALQSQKPQDCRTFLNRLTPTGLPPAMREDLLQVARLAEEFQFQEAARLLKPWLAPPPEDTHA